MVPSEGSIPIPRVIDLVRYSYFAIHVWSWAMTSIKVSAAVMLLRIRDTFQWRCFLYGIIFLQVSYCIGNMVFLFNACHPLATWWDRSIPGGSCISDSSVLIASYTGSSINMLTDILLSLSPIVFLRKLNRPLGERVMLCVLMGLGLLATLSSLIKIITVHVYNSTLWTDEVWTFVVAIGTWTVLEQLFAVLAACAPFMKIPVERALAVFGVHLSPREDSASRFRGGFRDTFRIEEITSSAHPDTQRWTDSNDPGLQLTPIGDSRPQERSQSDSTSVAITVGNEKSRNATLAG